MKFTVSKLDAVKRQLDTAIRLYFSDGDPVSIHTLTAAAYNILRDISEKKATDPMLIKTRMLDYVRPEHHKEIIAKINEAENFFKHADRDHDVALDFNPEMTELLIIDACAQYKKLTSEEPPLFIIYRVWFTANHPDAFILADEFKEALKASIVQMERAQYFSLMLPLVMRFWPGVADPN